MQAISRMNNMLKYANFCKNHANNTKLGVYHDAWYTGHSGAYLVMQSGIMMEWGEFFAHGDNM